jgi:teichuronic acid exporter
MKVRHGIKWNFYKAIGNFLIKFIYGIVVAKLLGPKIIGQLGMIVAFSGFASVLINSGFKSRIIQVKEINKDELNTIYAFNILIGFVLTILFFLSSNLIANFFSYPELSFYIKIYSINFILQSLILVPLALNDRNLEFNKNTKSLLLANLLALIVAICLILLGYELMSLIIYSIAANVFSIIFIYLNSDWKPSYFFNFSLLKSHLPYSLNLLYVRFFEEFVAKIDNVVTGKYFDAVTLGLFSKSNDIASLPNSLITSSINNTLFPYFSRSQDNQLNLNKSYSQFLFGITFVYINIFLTLVFFSKEIVLILLSEDWLPMLPYFNLVLIIMMIKGVSSFKGYFILSKGDSKIVSNSLYLSGIIKVVLIGVLLLINVKFTPMIFLFSALISEVVLFLTYENITCKLLAVKMNKSIFITFKNFIFLIILYLIIFSLMNIYAFGIIEKLSLYFVTMLFVLFLYHKFSGQFKNLFRLILKK